jgi:tetratricopeptide (TPR) repeat protein
VSCRRVILSTASVCVPTVALLLVAALSLTSAQEAPNADLEQAVQLQRAGDLERAVSAYQKYLERHPDSFPALANLGAALAGLGRYSEAIERYRAALKLDPDNVGLRFNLALAHYKSARISEAASEFSAVRTAQPDNKNAAILLGDCYLRLGEHKKVIELLSPLLDKYSGDHDFLYLLGTALIRDNQLERGQILVDKILRDGESAEAHMMLGTARLKGNDRPGALKEFERAVQLNPKLVSAHASYGRALLDMGDHQKAVEAFMAELQLNPNDFESNLYLGVLSKGDQEYEKALAYLHRALEIRPGAADVRYQIGSVYVSTGKLAQARELLEELVSEAPNFLEAHVSLATVYYRLKRKEDGDRERTIVQKLNAEIQARQPGVPQSSEAPSRKTETLGTSPSPKAELHESPVQVVASSPPTAVPFVAKTISVSPGRRGASGSDRRPTSFDGIAERADAARNADRVESAMELYRTGLKLRPSWAEGWWYLGTLLYDQDRYEEGREAFHRYTAVEPKQGAGWALLGLCDYQVKAYERALVHLERGRALGLAGNPQLSSFAEYYVALLLTRSEEFEAALQILLRFARRHEENPALVEAAGIAALRKPLLPTELPPLERELVLQVGRAVMDSGARRSAQAQKEFEDLIASNPKTSNLHYMLGSFLLLSDPDAALRELAKELEISPRHVPALLQIAFEYLNRGDAEAALGYARKAEEIDPQSFVAHNAVGRALVASGDLQNGIKELELSKQLAPDSPQTRIALASAYAKAGRSQDAARERAEFLKLNQLKKQPGEK